MYLVFGVGDEGGVVEGGKGESCVWCLEPEYKL